jgi:magnesium transporter
MSASQDHPARAQGSGGALSRLERVIGSALRLPGLSRADSSLGRKRPGASPGIESQPLVDEPPAEGTVVVRCIDFGPGGVHDREVDDLEALFSEERPEGCPARWINVDGLHPYTINRLREHFGFHTLAAEDVFHVPQRAKVEPYEDHVFVVVHMLMLVDGELVDEQVSLVLVGDTVLTFQERTGDVWGTVRSRISDATSRLRRGKSSYLLYALLDAIVDQLFPILEHFGDELEQLEERIIGNATAKELQELYETKRELVMLRRVLWPLRQVTDDLHRSELVGIDKSARTYLRDVYDHTLQVLDIVETYREMARGLTDLHMSAVSGRMNEIMKVLTIMASLFIPITFLAGVYGMNFEHIPELGWSWAYPTFWLMCLLVLGGLVAYFRRKGWIGGG